MVAGHCVETASSAKLTASLQDTLLKSCSDLLKAIRAGVFGIAERE